MTADKNKWSYLAGIIDGEGSISILDYDKTWEAKRRNNEEIPFKYFCLLIQIANTNLKLMRWLVENFGGVFYEKRHPQHLNWKPSYYWKPKGKKNKEILLLNILPYLILKTEQANLALQYLRLGTEKAPEKRLILAESCRKLNQRGISPTTNTFDKEQSLKIESELIGDNKSELVVTQAS